MGDRLLHCQGGQHGSFRVVLMRHHGAKKSDQTISSELVHHTAKTVDFSVQQLEDPVHDPHPGFCANFFEQVCGAVDIRQDDRRHPLLAFNHPA